MQSSRAARQGVITTLNQSTQVTHHSHMQRRTKTALECSRLETWAQSFVLPENSSFHFSVHPSLTPPSSLPKAPIPHDVFFSTKSFPAFSHHTNLSWRTIYRITYYSLFKKCWGHERLGLVEEKLPQIGEDKTSIWYPRLDPETEEDFSGKKQWNPKSP